MKNPKDKSTKETIIELLAEEWPLSARIIWNRMKKQYSKNITYQACYKVMQKMIEDKIIVKKDNKYRLSKTWIKRSKEFFENLEKNYFGKKTEKTPYSKAHLKKHVTYEFKTVAEMANFLGNYFFDFPNPENKPLIFRWLGIYSILGIPKEYLKKVKDIIDKNSAYITCQANTFYDKALAKAYLSFTKNIKIKLGVQSFFEYDHIILGDYIARLYFSPEMRKKTRKFKSSIKSFLTYDIKGLFEIMHQEFDPPNYIIVEKNPIIAEEIRKNTKDLFKEE